MSKDRRNILRACILSVLMTMPVAGVCSASSYPWTDEDNIGGTYEIKGRNHAISFDESEKTVQAKDDVIIKNGAEADLDNNDDTMSIISTVGEDGNSFTFDMNGKNITAGDYGSFINLTGGSNNKAEVVNAWNITSTTHKANLIYAVGSGHNISLDASNDIQLNKKRSDSPATLISIAGDNLLHLSAGRDVILTNENTTNILNLTDGGKAEVRAGRNLLFNQAKIEGSPILTVSNDYSLEMISGNDIVFDNEGNGNIIYGKQSQINIEAGRDIVYNHKHENGSPVNSFASKMKTRIKAGHDIVINSVRSTNLFKIVGGSSVAVVADNDILFHITNLSSLPAIGTTNNSSFSLKSRDFFSNAQSTLWAGNKSTIDIDASHDIKFITSGVNTVKGSMISSDSLGRNEVTADHDMILSIGVTARNAQATSGGVVNLTAGHDMILSTTGKDATNPRASNLYANDGTITAKVMDGTMSISNEGAVGAYADNGGSITFEGPVVMKVGSGAMAANSGTILFKGPVTLQSSATGLTADGGSITLDGDAAMNTTDGAVANNSGTILFNGPLTLQSSATGLTADGGSITLDGAAVMDTTDGAVATNGGTILFNGPLTLHSADTALRAADGGTIDATAADSDKYIEGNVVSNGGTVSLDLNTAGSYLTGTTSVSDSTASLDSSLNRAAVSDSTGTLNLTLGNGTVWNVTGDSSLTNLTNNGTVNMSGSNRTGQQVTAKTLSGTGTLVMDLDWLSNQGTKGVMANSDYLKVTDSATGTQSLVSNPTVMNLDKMGVNDRLYVAELNNSDAILTSPIQQRNVNKGHLYDYIIGLTHETTGNTTDWYFGSVASVESNVVPAAKVQNRTLFDMATHMDTLNKRLGEARYADGEDSGMWARLTYRHLGRDSYDGHSNRFELGYDTVKPSDDSTLRQGLSFSYLRSQTSFAEGQGKYKGYTGSLYRTWMGQKGHYLDVVGRIGRLNAEGTTRLTNGDESKSSFGTWYQQASVEWGRKKVLSDSWYVEPQSQLQYTHINRTNYRTSDGISQNFDSVHSLIGRLGFRLGKDIDANTSWYFKADILHEFAGNRTFDLTSVDGLERIRYDKTDHDTWYDVGAGITAELSHDRSLWFELERTFNGSYGRDWEINGGMTWRFH